MPKAILYIFSSIIPLLFVTNMHVNAQQTNTGAYDKLIQLCKDLRKLERTRLPNGVPDYRNLTIIKVQQTLLQYRVRLSAIDTVGSPTEQKVDFVLLNAEMNALDFNCRILKPWVRDPAFYAIVFGEQSDTPDHEGPTSFAAIELWKLSFPLSQDAINKLNGQLKVIPPLYDQARTNLTGNARDLWSAGIGNIQDQVKFLEELSAKTTNDGEALNNTIAAAKNASLKFISWLEKELPKKNGSSGIGKENYSWNLRHVMMVPMSWQEEVSLLQRELTRAYASLQLEREHNKNIPPIKPIASVVAYAEQTELSVKKLNGLS